MQWQHAASTCIPAACRLCTGVKSSVCSVHQYTVVLIGSPLSASINKTRRPVAIQLNQSTLSLPGVSPPFISINGDGCRMPEESVNNRWCSEPYSFCVHCHAIDWLDCTFGTIMCACTSGMCKAQRESVAGCTSEMYRPLRCKSWHTVLVADNLIVCPMLCICIGQNIKSRKRPSVRPSGVWGQECDVIHGPIFTQFGT